MADKVLEIHLLGAFTAKYNGRPITSLSSPRHQSLLAYLLLHRDEPQPRRLVAYLFWPDSDESQARTNFRKLLHDLRKVFPEIDQFLEAGGQTLVWRSDATYQLDVQDFEQAISKAPTIEGSEAALKLYRGNLLPNCYDDWILSERERLRQEYLNVLEKLVGLLERERQYSTAIAYAQQLLESDPLREEMYRRLMQLYALNGDPAGVLRTFHTCVTVLQRELGVEPSQITRDAYRRTLNLYESLSALPVSESQMVGRQEEWVKLQEMWMASLSGQVQIALISGPEGAGKTRLTEELLQWAATQGATVAGTHCYAGDEALPYAPLAQWLQAHHLPHLEKLWLGEISRLLPELQIKRPDLPTPEALKEPWQRHRFFEAVARALLSYQPILLQVDDLQWASADFLEWLHFFLHFNPGARAMIVATYRSTDVLPESPISAVLPSLRNESRVTEIELGLLSEADTGQLAEISTGRELDGSVKARVYQISGGNPLYVMEMMDATRPAPSGSGSQNQPATIQADVEERLKHLVAGAQSSGKPAAEVGKSSTPEQAPIIKSDQQDDPVSIQKENGFYKTISSLTSGLLHSFVGSTDYHRLDDDQRRRLHRRVAEALEKTYHEGLLDVSGEIAFHYEQADMLSQAAQYYLKAGNQALIDLAYESALEFYQRALALIPDGEQVAVIEQIKAALSQGGLELEAETLGEKRLKTALSREHVAQ
jgi:DNA-binding SARP family transcriptional activator